MPQDDMYDDGPAAAPEESAASEPAESSGDSKTSILPRSFFSEELKPGDKREVEIVAVHDSDYECKPADDAEPDSDADDMGEQPDSSDPAGAAQPPNGDYE